MYVVRQGCLVKTTACRNLFTDCVAGRCEGGAGPKGDQHQGRHHHHGASRRGDKLNFRYILIFFGSVFSNDLSAVGAAELIGKLLKAFRSEIKIHSFDLSFLS